VPRGLRTGIPFLCDPREAFCVVIGLSHTNTSIRAVVGVGCLGLHTLIQPPNPHSLSLPVNNDDLSVSFVRSRVGPWKEKPIPKIRAPRGRLLQQISNEVSRTTGKTGQLQARKLLSGKDKPALRRSHNPKVEGSNPSPATTDFRQGRFSKRPFFIGLRGQARRRFIGLYCT
jgi:hypothetical protein